MKTRMHETGTYEELLRSRKDRNKAKGIKRPEARGKRRGHCKR